MIRDLGSGWAAWFAPDGSIVQASGPPGSGLVTVERIGDAAPRLTIPIRSGNNFSVSPDAMTMATIDDDMHGITLTDTATLATSGHIDALPNTTLLDVWQYGNGVLGVVHDGSITSKADLQAAYDGPVQLEWWPPGASKPTTAIPSTGGADGVWAIDPDTTKIALPESSDTVAIYDLATGQRHKLTLDHHSVVGMTFTPDGRTLVTSGDDRLLDVWDADTGQLRDTFAGHAGRVFGPAISDAGGHLTAWSIALDDQLIEWDLTGDRRIDRPLSVGAAAMRDGLAVQTIAVSPDGRFVAATTDGGRVTVEDAKTLVTVKQLQALPPDAIATTLAFSPDSKTLAVGGQGDQSIATWDTASWTSTGPAFTVPTPSPSPGASSGSPPAPDGVTSVAWAPDGGLLASGSADGQISLWDPHSGHLAKTLNVLGAVFDLAFSGDSKSLAVTYSATDPSAGKAAVWSLPDGTLRYEVSVDDDYGSPFAATFSHDGKLLATGGGIGEIRFWDAATGAKIGRPVFGNAGWVSTLAFTADDSVLVAAGTDGTVRLIDPVERQQLGASLPGGVSDSIAAVGPDDRVFVDYEDTGLGYVWDISLDSLKTHACTLAGRTLTQTEWDQYLPGRPYQPTCGPG